MRTVYGLAAFLALSVATLTVTSPAGGLILEPIPVWKGALEQLPKPNDRQYQQNLEEVPKGFSPNPSDLSTEHNVLGGSTDLKASGTRPLSLEYSPTNISAPYLLIDASGQVLFAGYDEAGLVAELNQWLLLNIAEETHNLTGTAIYVEMKGFSEDKAAALETSLRIQQHLIDPSISFRVLPHFTEDPAPTDHLFVRGIKLEVTSPIALSIKREIAIDDTKITPKDKFIYHSDLYFSIRLPQRVSTVVVRITVATKELVQEFMVLVSQFLATSDFDQGQSLAELLNRVTRELKKRHDGLTEEQLRVDMIDQFGNIRIAKLPPGTAFVWS